MKTTRQAVMYVERLMLESLIPDWRTVVKLCFGDVIKQDCPENFEELLRIFYVALKLPDNCKIRRINHYPQFNLDQIALRIECPDFIETLKGCYLPEVQALYKSVQEEVKPDWSYFLRWDGPAVHIQRIYDADRREIGACNLRPAPEASANSVVADEQAIESCYRVSPCWSCKKSTSRRLPDGVAECQECAEKPLF